MRTLQLCLRFGATVLALASLGITETGAEEPGAAELYHQYCSVCHGDHGDGRSRARHGLIPPPRDFTSAESSSTLTRDRMLKAVLDGRPGTAMTGWRTRLTQEQALAVVDYIRERFMQPGVKKPNAAAQAAPAKQNRAPSSAPRGDFESGRVLYAGNCATCHGLKGDGDGPRAYFIFPKPRNFLAEETRRSIDREKLLAGIRDGVPGREMPAWRHVFTESQIADVSEYVYRAFLRPDSKARR
ncbi:MAG: c-type cytochrome [Betaproteobacteria bacterium]|nr:MAG: c-type cytochrome [Betaproteobacteria bacterium]